MSTVAEHLPFDPPGVVTVCGGITNYDWPWLKVGDKVAKEDCQKALQEAAERYADQVVKCVPSLPTMPPHRQAAIASFAVNLGAAKVCNTSIGRDLNAGRVREGDSAGSFTKTFAALRLRSSRELLRRYQPQLDTRDSRSFTGRPALARRQINHSPRVARSMHRARLPQLFSYQERADL